MRISKFFIVIIWFLTGCYDRNPELKDPIYKDLSSMVKQAESEVKMLESQIEDYAEDLKDIKPHSHLLKGLRRRLDKTRWNKFKALQRVDYLKLRLESRKAAARAEYDQAFNSGKEWPDPEVSRFYKVSKQLRTADRNWSKRMPPYNKD